MSVGNFQRPIYDVGAYQAEVKQSTGPLLYRLDPVFANQKTPMRLHEPGYLGGAGVSLQRENLVDVENNLFRLNERLTLDPMRRYRPEMMQGHQKNGYPSGTGVIDGRSSSNMMHFKEYSLGREYTRLINPPCTLRGTGVNRFHIVQLNPQDEERWLHPGAVGISSRLVVKDNHTPCVPTPMSQTSVLPPAPPADGGTQCVYPPGGSGWCANHLDNMSPYLNPK